MEPQAVYDYEQLKRVTHSLKSATTIFTKAQIVMQLLNSPQFIIEQFSQSGLKHLKPHLKDALKNIHVQSDLFDKILTLISKMSLNSDTLKESGLTSSLLKLKDRKLFESIRSREQQEILFQKSLTLYNRYKSLLESSKKGKYDDHTKKKVKRSTSSEKKPKKKQVRFPRDDMLIAYKVFKRDDEPAARGMTETEVQQFQRAYYETMRSGPQSAYDIKHRESQMEGRSHRQILDNVQHMIEQIPFAKLLQIREPQIIFTEEASLQQKRIESKMSVYYSRDMNIPAEPAYEAAKAGISQLRMIHLDAPKREDLMFMINIMCEKGQKEMQDKKRNYKFKSILKRPPDEVQKQKDQFEQAKQDLQPKVTELTRMIENRAMYSQEQILSLLNEIIIKFKAMNSEEYIVNIKRIIEMKLNSQQSQNNEEQMMRQRQEVQRLRQEQMMISNPQMAQRMRAYKTKYCHNYHSPKGCTRGEACNFIHEPKYQGYPVPQNITNMQIPNLLNKDLFSQQQVKIQFMPSFLQQLNPSLVQKRYDSL